MAVPPSGNVTGGVRRWRAFGNISLPDCVFAAAFTIVWVQGVTSASRFKKILYRVGFRPPTARQVIAAWKAYCKQAGYDPAKSGAYPADGLNYLQSVGVIDHWANLNIDAASIDSEGLAGEDRLHEYMLDFRGLVLAGEMTERAYNSTAVGPHEFVWDLLPGDVPSPRLGHAVAMLEYRHARDGIETWGTFGWMTQAFREKCFNGAYIFVTPAQRADADYAMKVQRITALNRNNLP